MVVPKKFRFWFSLLVALSILAVMLTLAAANPAHSQENTCLPTVAAAARLVNTSLGAVAPGFVSYASGKLSVAPQPDAAEVNFQKMGDHAALASLKSITGSTGDTWSAAPFRVQGATAVLLGSATLTTTFSPADKLPTLTAKNARAVSVNVYAGPDNKTTLLGTLAPNEQVAANGRTDKSDWIRFARDGVLAWVPADSVALDKEPETLKAADPTDVSALYQEPFRALTLAVAQRSKCRDTPDGLLIDATGSTSRFIVNGVQLTLSGAVFITADASNVMIYGLRGQTLVSTLGEQTALSAGRMTTVPVQNGVPGGKASSPVDATGNNYLDILNSLVYGQLYTGVGSTTAGIGIAVQRDTAAVNHPLRVDLSYTGDAAQCSVLPSTDIALVVDSADAFSGATSDAIRAGINQLLHGLRRDDQLSLVQYGPSSKVITQFGEPLTSAVLDTLEPLQPGTLSSARAGISEGLSQLKSSKRVRTLLLVTLGIDDPESLRQAAKAAKDASVRLIVVGIGDSSDKALLEEVAGADNVFLAQDADSAREAIHRAALALVKPVAIHDAALTYAFDSTRLSVDKALVRNTGGTLLDANTIEWRLPAVRDGETLHFPILFKPQSVGDVPLGSAKLFYTSCVAADKKITSNAISGDSVKVASTVAVRTATIDSTAAVLNPEERGTGFIAGGSEQSWVVSSPAEQTLSIVTESSQPLQIGLSDATLLYTLDHFGDANHQLNVFYVPTAGERLLKVFHDAAGESISYSLAVKDGLAAEPSGVLTLDAEPLTVLPDAGLNGVFAVPDAKLADQAITINLRAGEPVAAAKQHGLPLRLVSADGQLASVLYTRFDAGNNAWETVQQIRGKAPYFVIVSLADAYELGLESGDVLTRDRGSLTVGESRRQVAKTTQTEIFKYQVTVPDNKRISLITSGDVRNISLRDPKNARLAFASQLTVNTFQVSQVNLPAGDYTLFLEASGNFEVSVSPAEQAALAGLKGSLSLGQTRQDVIQQGQPFAAYSLVIGAGKPLGEDSVVTVYVSGKNADNQSAYIESVDGVRSEILQDFIDQREQTRQQLISVQRLKGSAPYRVRMVGLQRYVIRLEQGDLLSSDKGSLVVGQTVRDSSRSPEIITYTLVPELGKRLVEGDLVTVGFTPQSDQDAATFESVPVSLRNGNKLIIPVLKSYRAAFGRQFFAVYQLSGQAPYVLELPNLGAYTVNLRQGNALEVDEGKLDFDKVQQARTDGPQLISYSLEAPEAQVVTLTLRDTRGQRSNFNVTMQNAAGEVIAPRRFIVDTGAQSLVYTLRGKGPYHFQFEMDGIYEATVKKGDSLTLYKGNFHIGDAESNKVADRTRLVTYSLTMKAGQTITVRVDDYRPVTLRDPNDAIVTPQQQLQAFKDNAYLFGAVFQARRAGLYELSFSRLGNYTVRVKDGDDLTLEKGNIYFGAVEKDTLAPDKMFARYEISGESGQQITVGAAIDSVRQPDFPIQIFNAAGDLQQIEDQETVGGEQRWVYTLSGDGPYTMVLQTDKGFRSTVTKYTLSVNAGDTLRLDKGTLALNTPTAGDTGGKDVLRKVMYTIDGTPGKTLGVTVETKGQSRRLAFGTLTDANGTVVPAVAYGSTQTASLTSFRLLGTGPYSLAFTLSGDYTVTASDPDQLVIDQGKLAADAPVTTSLKAPAQVATYTIDGKEGDQVTLQLKQGGSGLVGEVRNANNEFVQVDDQYFDQGLAVYLLRLTGPAPYKLTFAPGTQPYTVTLTAQRDILNAQLGALTLNPAKSDDPKFKPTVVSGKLAAPARIAYYTIDGKDGDLITLQIGPRGGSAPLKPRIVNKEGVQIEPLRTVIAGAKTNALYKLAGTAPYTLIFESASDYEITATQGDVLRVSKGTLGTGAPLKDKIDAPAQVGTLQLDAAAGQVITVQLQNSGKAIESTVYDAQGNELKPEVTDFQNGNNIGVYILSGTGPYTLEFPASGQFTASLQAGNLVRLDQGLITFQQEIKGTLPPPARVGSYTVAGKRDQLITVQFQSDGAQRQIEFRDANNKLWSPDFQFTKGNQVFLVYALSGPPPYTVTFSGQRYTVTVSDGNVVRSDKGDAPLGQKVSDKLTAPAQVAVYTVQGSPGDLMSIQLTSGGRPLQNELRDAKGKLLKRDTEVVRGNLNVSVYTLSGTGPYVLEFAPSNTYDLTVSKGNVLRVSQGKIEPNKELTATLPAPGQTAIYTIEASDGDLISVQLQVNNKPGKMRLTNIAGDEQQPDARSEKTNTTRAIYTLHGSGPFTLEFDTDGAYKVQVSTGNVLRAYQGVIRFGNTITDQLAAPKEIAIYTIDGVPGQVISVRIQDNGQPVDSQLRDGDGNRVQPTGKSNANNAAYTVYTLSGKAPYTVTFLPAGRYSITLTNGTVFEADQGIIPFNTAVSNTLQPPSQIAAYTLNTESGQIISAKIDRGTQNNAVLVAELRDADGKVIEPKTRIVDVRGSVIYVYVLSTAGPYRFTFAPTGQYTITFTRGDASIPLFPIFPTGTPTSTPAP